MIVDEKLFGCYGTVPYYFFDPELDIFRNEEFINALNNNTQAITIKDVHIYCIYF